MLAIVRLMNEVKKCEHPDADEEMLMVKTFRDSFINKLVSEDIPVFFQTLIDIYPK